ncbi:thioesterase family protein [Pseudovibrio exalbescens]|uniref:Fluoroacetyl-CoA-specific thioesterase-like domain-containing protein n=1 Tax=Pseudovibrio exalbescens TaxID=197461 RepID=A0A1U7JCY2_9HYPH|nr:thioesterase family protein [Pseudovibrio exalbescens]OKL42599.1 hypothetical protein A3843_18260 [Pseudovibrio exalbescens]
MRDTLKIGDEFTFEYVVDANKTVPNLYPESEEYRKMPEVFATGFMVGLLEWCCIEALHPHLDEGEGSLGTFISTSHCAPTPPGMKVTVTARCVEIRNSNNVFWEVVARDELEVIAEGRHGRHVIQTDRFLARVDKKKQTLERSAA